MLENKDFCDSVCIEVDLFQLILLKFCCDDLPRTNFTCRGEKIKRTKHFHKLA